MNNNTSSSSSSGSAAPSSNESNELLSNAKGSSGNDASRRAKMMQVAAAMGLVPVNDSSSSSSSSLEVKEHKFWDTQPVPKLGETVTMHGPLETKTIDQVKVEPYNLPAGFEWSVIDIMDTNQMNEMYDLLANNYVEDDDNMFRFAYSPAFLQWALTPPGYYKDWHIGVRITKSKKLVACITGIPADMKIYETIKKLCEINFLCVDKKLRSKRLAPVLIKEVTRRVNLKDIWQAAYTAGVVLPKPVTSCRYWHRSLDPKKLIEVGFSRLPPRMTMQRVQRLYKLADEPRIPGFRPIRAEDVPEAAEGLRNYLNNYKLHPYLHNEDFSHWLLSRENVIDTFVIDIDQQTNNNSNSSKTSSSSSKSSTASASTITTTSNPRKLAGLVSFYHLPSTVIGHTKHKDLRAAYLYYYYTIGPEQGGPTLELLIESALIAARNKGIDVFNCLDLLNNQEFLTNLKFGEGDGYLQYYLYNWNCPAMEPKELGLVLL